MKKIFYIIFFVSLFAACNLVNDNGECDTCDNITLSFSVNSYIKDMAVKSAVLTADDEQAVENLYVFLFPTTGGQTLKSYTVDGSVFNGGTWSDAEKRVSLTLTQAEAGKRNVYLVANYPEEMGAKLDAVGSAEDLEEVFHATANPWSDDLGTPILMSGDRKHDFNADSELNAINLVRALAKVELRVTLSESFRSALSGENGSAPEYQFRYVDFDLNTFAVKPASKADDLTTSPWNDWAVSGITTDSQTGEATGLLLTTYLNERDTKGAKVELKLPYSDGGLLPPPEFGDETYTLPLPDKVERNHWYVYDVEI